MQNTTNSARLGIAFSESYLRLSADGNVPYCLRHGHPYAFSEDIFEDYLSIEDQQYCVARSSNSTRKMATDIKSSSIDTLYIDLTCCIDVPAIPIWGNDMPPIKHLIVEASTSEAGPKFFRQCWNPSTLESLTLSGISFHGIIPRVLPEDLHRLRVLRVTNTTDPSDGFVNEADKRYFKSLLAKLCERRQLTELSLIGRWAEYISLDDLLTVGSDIIILTLVGQNYWLDSQSQARSLRPAELKQLGKYCPQLNELSVDLDLLTVSVSHI